MGVAPRWLPWLTSDVSGRTLIIGDVHGCAEELERLLRRISFAAADRLVSVGDLIARGPESSRVLSLLRECGGQAVLGNHEERLLQAWRAKQEGKQGPRLGPGHQRLLQELSEADWAQLAALPYCLELPQHGLRVLHAGLLPSLAFAKQEPWTLTHIRTVTDGKASSKPGGQLWATLYDGPPHIVFGHHASQKLQLHPWATGLDTGCVYGGELTGLLLSEGASVPQEVELRRSCLVSVRAQRNYAGT